MLIIEKVREMQDYSESLRGRGGKIAFVPTMGSLHHGHVSLLQEGRKVGHCLVTSIYVNPTQFGPKEDLSKYPRNFVEDRRLCEAAGVDVIFYPSDREMYPENYQTYVDLEKVTNHLCGLSRPGHFRGVATICTKLFNIVKPHVSIFGKKDFQQLVVIRKMVKDLNLDMEIIGCPTVRDPDGLAMSSRNAYLKPEERKSALCLNRSLKLAISLFDGGERKAETIIRKVSQFIEEHPHAQIDYVKICDAETMEDMPRIERGTVIALAVKVGLTRLIDNHVFGETFEN